MIDKYTGAGFLVAAILVLLQLLMTCVFREPGRTVSGAVELDDDGDDGLNAPLLDPIAQAREEEAVGQAGGGGAPPIPRLRRRTLLRQLLVYVRERGVWVCYVINFANNFQMSLLETSVAPIALFSFDWDPLQISYFFCVMAAVTAASMATVAITSSKCDVRDRTFLLVGQIMMGATITFALSSWPMGATYQKIPEPLFVTAGLLIVLAIPVQGAPCGGLHSKLLGSKDVGFFLSLLQVVNVFSRIAGPLWAGYCLVDFDYVKMLSGVALTWVCAGTVLWWKWHFINPDELEARERKKAASRLEAESTRRAPAAAV